MRFTAMSLALIFISLALFGAQQQSSGPPFEQPTVRDGQREKIEKEMEKQANKQRQEDVRRDTDRLLELATELKQYVDKSNENVLSVNVVKKADEIEKLAHSVKDKMKGH
jgi:hypothetical protein